MLDVLLDDSWPSALPQHSHSNPSFVSLQSGRVHNSGQPTKLITCANQDNSSRSQRHEAQPLHLSVYMLTLLVMSAAPEFSHSLCCHAALARFVDNNKKKTSILSSMLLILVPWMQISKAVVSNVPVTPSALTAVLAAGVALHLVFLAFNLTATTALQLGQTATDDGAICAYAHCGCFQQHAVMFK